MNYNLFTYKMKVLFWHRKQKTNARGEAPIYCRITINGERGNDFSTNVFCPVGLFNAGKQTILNDDISNMRLASLKHKINSIYLELENRNEKIRPKIIIDYLNGKRNFNITLLQLLEEYRSHREKQVLIGEISQATAEKTSNLIKNICMFLDSLKIRNILLCDFTPKIATEFYYWIQEHKNTGQDYAAKTMGIIKSIFNYAVLNEYLPSNSLLSLRFKHGPKKRIEFLKEEQLEALKSYKFANKRLQAIADLFIFQCYTGFSYADIAEFNPDSHIEKDTEGREWIIKPKAKNNQEAVLPYFRDAKSIIEKYTVMDENGLKLLLPIITNQRYNSYLKEVGELIETEITLTTHIGRKTFGTITLNKGFSIDSVSRMLGHSNIKTTQGHYAVILRKKILSEM